MRRVDKKLTQRWESPRVLGTNQRGLLRCYRSWWCVHTCRVVCPYLKGFLQFWSPGGCSGVREEELETIKGLKLLLYEQTQRARMLQFVEKAQGR